MTLARCSASASLYRSVPSSTHIRKRKASTANKYAPFFWYSDAFVILSENDSVSRRFLNQTLRPLFLREEWKCLTAADFVPGVSYQNNFDNAILFCKIVIIIVTIGLMKDRRCKRELEAVLTDDVTDGKCRVNYILVEPTSELPSYLKSITGIPYDNSQPDCNDELARKLKIAFLFQETHKWGPSKSSTCNVALAENSEGSGQTAPEVIQLSQSSDEMPVSSEISASDSEADEPTQHPVIQTLETGLEGHRHAERSNELTTCPEKIQGSQELLRTPQTFTSSNPQLQYHLDIFKVYRSSWFSFMRSALLLKSGDCTYSVLIQRGFIFAITLTMCLSAVYNSDMLIIGLFRACLMVSVAFELYQHMKNLQRPIREERLEFCELSVHQIGNHLAGESEIATDDQEPLPADIFDCLCRFLRSVALVNFLAACFYSISVTILLGLIGYYDTLIYQGSTMVSYAKVLCDAFFLIMTQAYLRTLIGIYHYERALLVEAHRIAHKQQTDNFRKQIHLTATFLRKRANTWSSKALIISLPIALVCTAALAFADTGIIPTKSYACLVAWLFVLEALINCPKRHMKVAAVAANSLAIFAVVLLKWTDNWKTPDFEQSLAHFLPPIELRMLCLILASFLLLDGITHLQTNNWPLPSLDMRMKKAITVPLVILLVGSAMY